MVHQLMVQVLVQISPNNQQHSHLHKFLECGEAKRYLVTQQAQLTQGRGVAGGICQHSNTRLTQLVGTQIKNLQSCRNSNRIGGQLRAGCPCNLYVESARGI